VRVRGRSEGDAQVRTLPEAFSTVLSLSAFFPCPPASASPPSPPSFFLQLVTPRTSAKTPVEKAAR